jgi:hypothetical protein
VGYQFKPGLQYLMPTHFGPMAGPRQAPDGSRWTLPDDRIKESYAITVEGRARELEALLPEGFVLDGAPELTVAFSYQTNIGWLAGRGYNMLGVTIPARYEQGAILARGPFLLVLWENLADPIITGREQLGYSKVYCELPEPRSGHGAVVCTASWMGHWFMELQVAGLETREVTQRASARASGNEITGTMHLMYLPRVGALTDSGLVESVITSSSAIKESVLAEQQGSGTLRILPTTWNDMPTQYHIVEGLRNLTLNASGRVIYRRVRGSGDLLEQQPLRSAKSNAEGVR